jgi:hypothetical protein
MHHVGPNMINHAPQRPIHQGIQHGERIGSVRIAVEEGQDPRQSGYRIDGNLRILWLHVCLHPCQCRYRDRVAVKGELVGE